MKIFVSETKKNFMLYVTTTLISLMAFEIEFLNMFYPANKTSSALFMIFAFLNICVMLYYYQKAKKEDKLTEGL